MNQPSPHASSLFRGRHFDPAIIILCVRWHSTYKLSYRDLLEMMAERGVDVSRTTILRWVQSYVPEFEKRWQSYAQPVGTSWRVDETYIRVKGLWTCLYRAVDKQGLTVDFLLSEKRDTATAKRFFSRAIGRHGAPSTGLTRKSVTAILLRIRERIAEGCERQPPSGGEVEVDESYFAARRVRGRRGRGAPGKTVVFGILKRNGCVYTGVVPGCRKRTLSAVIRGRIAPGAVTHSGGWRGYDGLVGVGYAKHFRVNHPADESARGAGDVDGIESFWSYAGRRLEKFDGVPERTSDPHLKECE